MPSPVFGAKGNREFLVTASLGGPVEEEDNLVAAALA
jgi:hypothetical protein